MGGISFITVSSSFCIGLRDFMYMYVIIISYVIYFMFSCVIFIFVKDEFKDARAISARHLFSTCIQ